MNDRGPDTLCTVTARAHYESLPGTQHLAVGVALTSWQYPDGDDIQPVVTAEFANWDSFPVNLIAFAGDPPVRWWVGVEIHSRHSRIRTSTVDVLAVAETDLAAERHDSRPLPGLEDWTDPPPVGLLWGFPTGHPGTDVCRFGSMSGWMVHPQRPSTGTFELAAPVVRWRADPTSEEAQQLGVVTVHVTIT